ncbi:hypothetical protein AB9M92_12365 [Peribacillus frigoritolerans]|uniref:hypothetical protein n=1 Tax=Peribacillus frigoritolerans TaxID=450367 RepID=UPI003515975E
MSYSATLIPAMLSIWAFSHLERFLRKIIPQNLQIFAVALISLLIMVPITAMVIGPIGVFLALDRFGRNMEETLQEWNDITKNIQADIVVMDMPLLYTTQFNEEKTKLSQEIFKTSKKTVFDD